MVYDTIGATPHSWAGTTAGEVRATAERKGSILIEYSDSGAVGEPELASAEKGTEIYRRLGDERERLLRRGHEGSGGE